MKFIILLTTVSLVFFSCASINNNLDNRQPSSDLSNEFKGINQFSHVFYSVAHSLKLNNGEKIDGIFEISSTVFSSKARYKQSVPCFAISIQKPDQTVRYVQACVYDKQIAYFPL